MSDEEKTTLKKLNTAAATSFNAHLLTSIGRAVLKWTDCLACHLELDTSSNTLYVIRYPSFCVANLSSQNLGDPPKTAIHACATPCATSLPWATRDEVTQMLREIVLSYRLLFGQNKASRQFFWGLKPFNSIPEKGEDRVLMALCGQKKHRLSFEVPQREKHDLSRDFPVLRRRLAILLQHLSTKRPRTWKELWHDKRDSASWFAFWAVLIIGGVGITLAFIQVILQAVQIAF